MSNEDTLPHRRTDGVLRRIDVSRTAPIEDLLHAAVALVEQQGASAPLTECTVLIGKAIHRLADHLEGCRCGPGDSCGVCEAIPAARTNGPTNPERTERDMRCDARLAVAVAALEDIAGRLGPEHEAWAAAPQHAPCGCVLHVAKRALEEIRR